VKNGLERVHVVLHAATESEDRRALSHHKFCESILIAMKDEAFQLTPIVRRHCHGVKQVLQMPQYTLRS
jgi:hypothetical protein